MTKIEELKAALEGCSPSEPLSVEPDVRYPDSLWIGSESGYFAQVGPCASGLFESDEAAAKFIALAHNLMPQLLKAVDLLKEVDTDFGYNRSQEKRLETALRIEQFIHGELK